MFPKPLTSRSSLPNTPSRPSFNSSTLSLTQTQQSQLSLSQTLPSSAFKKVDPNNNKYPKCQSKKQHSKEVLNLVCLTEGCKNRGPICVACKSGEHQGHTVVTVRKFLQMVAEGIGKGKDQEKKEKIIMTQPSQPIPFIQQKLPQSLPSQPIPPPPSLIQTLQTHRSRMLFSLHLQIQHLSQQIRLLQQKILTQTETALHQLSLSQNLSQNIHKIITQLKQKQYEDASVYRGRINQIMGFVSFKNKDQCQVEMEACGKIVERVGKMAECFVGNMEDWAGQNMRMLKKIFENNPNRKVVASQQKQKQDTTTSPVAYKFSPQYKIKSITLQNQNKSAKLSQKLPGFILFSSPIQKQKKFRIKITNLSNSILIGLCHKDIVHGNGYKLLSTSNIGHGGYLIGNNTIMYSNVNKSQNNVTKGISFATGDEIVVSLKADCVNFYKKKNHQNKTVSVQMKKMTDEELKGIYGCVYLGGPGDRVELCLQQ